jgi:ribonuclease-3 family protein
MASAGDGFDPRMLSPELLAYVGDAVQELDVRRRLVLAGGRMQDLHRQAVARVRAEAQARVLALVEAGLDDEERTLLVRLRNHSQRTPAGQDPALRHRSQALEGLLGYWYLAGKTERLKEVLDVAWRVGE